MAKTGFLGLGMMGSGMASCLLKAGHDVTVWNRSPDKVPPLVASGAVQAATPQDAARGADSVLSMVAGDAASDACWIGTGGALDGLAPGAFVIECSTMTGDQRGGSPLPFGTGLSAQVSVQVRRKCGGDHTRQRS